MPFKKVFERSVNENMNDGEPARAPPAETDDADTDMKKQLPPSTPDLEAKAQDPEWSEKQDRPPRFSTLFGVAPPLPPREFESYPQPKQKSGVFLSTPIFVLFVVILLFESTLLFAYTVIGLYNNLPQRLVPTGAVSCQCEEKPAINIAPNFVMPQAQAPVAQTVTVFGQGALPNIIPTSTSTTSSSSSSSSTSTSSTTSTSTSSTSSINTASQVAAIASDVMSMFRTLTTSTSTTSSTSSSSSSSSVTLPSVVTVTSTPISTQILSVVQPSPTTAQSTLLLTVNAAGSTLAPQSTVTSTQVINASAAVSTSVA